MEITTNCQCGCGEPVSPGKQWVQGHHLRIQKPAPKAEIVPSDDEHVEDCARVCLDFIGSLDPDWKKRIEILVGDNDWTARQALGSMAAYVLDRSLHMEMPRHPYFEKGNHPYKEKQCPVCETSFKPKQPGQIYCSNDCAFKITKVKAA